MAARVLITTWSRYRLTVGGAPTTPEERQLHIVLHQDEQRGNGRRPIQFPMIGLVVLAPASAAADADGSGAVMTPATALANQHKVIHRALPMAHRARDTLASICCGCGGRS
jgi:hypothetical protein